MLLTGRRGERVPLGRVAHIGEIQARETINHENAERRLVVQTNVRGRLLFVTFGRLRQAGLVLLNVPV